LKPGETLGPGGWTTRPNSEPLTLIGMSLTTWAIPFLKRRQSLLGMNFQQPAVLLYDIDAVWTGNPKVPIALEELRSIFGVKVEIEDLASEAQVIEEIYKKMKGAGL